MLTPKQVATSRRRLDRHRSLLTQFPSPMPLGPFELIIERESGWRADCLTKQRTFWEYGLRGLTVEFKTGKGRAMDANVDPGDVLSSIYGAQFEYADDIKRWQVWLSAHGFDVPRATDVDAWVTLMHAPYSVGWSAIKQILLAGRVDSDPIEALHGALALSDAELPDPGPQTDKKIRFRIRKLLRLPEEGNQIEPLPLIIRPMRARTSRIVPYPRPAKILLTRLDELWREKHGG